MAGDPDRINTGEVAVGAGEVFASGDAVNVAARLEQAAEPGEIFISGTTHALVRLRSRSRRPGRSISRERQLRSRLWRLRGLIAEMPSERQLDTR